MIRIAPHRTWAALLVAAACGLGLLMMASPVSAQNASVQKLTNADVAKIKAEEAKAAVPQPIAFSHKVHAGVNQIDCQYCHIYARRSWVAGVPPVEVCAGCHKHVGASLDEVKKVMTYWKDQKPIPWAKNFDVPDFVHFPHYKHVDAHDSVFPNGVPCQDCHGQIQDEDVVKKPAGFGLMGWCLKCHLKIPGTLGIKQAIASPTNPRQFLDYKHPGGNYRRPLLADCVTCHF